MSDAHSMKAEGQTTQSSAAAVTASVIAQNNESFSNSNSSFNLSNLVVPQSFLHQVFQPQPSLQQIFLQNILSNHNQIVLTLFFAGFENKEPGRTSRSVSEKISQQLTDQLQISILQQAAAAAALNNDAAKSFHAHLQQVAQQQLLTQQANSNIQLSSSISSILSNANNGNDVNRVSIPNSSPAPSNSEVLSRCLVDFLSRATDQNKLSSLENSKLNALYHYQRCRWPGCEAHCSMQEEFIRHLNVEHNLDDRSAAQTRVQIQVVEQIESQLNREREILNAMLFHLQMKSVSISSMNNSNVNQNSSYNANYNRNSVNAPVNKNFQLFKSDPGVASSDNINYVCTPLNKAIVNKKFGSHSTSSGRRAGERTNLPVSLANRSAYTNADIRPPFTYATLIRQAILESPESQLTLNEIYGWFENNFQYFRKNAQTWKNAVRHNLSLHKCFMRVQNIKGAVWTVDDMEFTRRRSLRSHNETSPYCQQNVGMKSSPDSTFAMPIGIDDDYKGINGIDIEAESDGSDFPMSHGDNIDIPEEESCDMGRPMTDRGNENEEASTKLVCKTESFDSTQPSEYMFNGSVHEVTPLIHPVQNRTLTET